MTGLPPLAVHLAAAALHAHAVAHIPGATPFHKWDRHTQRQWEQRAAVALTAALPAIAEHLKQGTGS